MEERLDDAIHVLRNHAGEGGVLPPGHPMAAMSGMLHSNGPMSGMGPGYPGMSMMPPGHPDMHVVSLLDV